MKMIKRRGRRGRLQEQQEHQELGRLSSWSLTHHEVAAEVVLPSVLVPFAHGLHPLDKLSQDAGLLHPSVLLGAVFSSPTPEKQNLLHPKVSKGQITGIALVKRKVRGEGKGKGE